VVLPRSRAPVLLALLSIPPRRRELLAGTRRTLHLALRVSDSCAIVERTSAQPNGTLVRKSRCFSRYIIALGRAVKLVVWCYNQRQLWNHLYPQYPKQVIHFVPPRQ
jgi:hypothetical protein